MYEKHVLSERIYKEIEREKEQWLDQLLFLFMHSLSYQFIVRADIRI